MSQKEKYSTQILRIDCKNGFFEVLNDMFQAPFNKVHINFVTYDEQTKKQTRSLNIYLDIGKTLLLCNDILSGKLNATVKKAKTTGNFNNVPINDFTAYFLDLGGISEQKVASKIDSYTAKHPWLQPGTALSRQFKIQAGQKMPWVFRAEYGPGRSNETGLIAPIGKTEEAITIPLSNEDLKIFALTVQMHLQAYYNQFYSKLSTSVYKDEDIKVYNKNAQPVQSYQQYN